MNFDPQGPAGLPITIRPTPNVEAGRANNLSGDVVHFTAGLLPGCLEWLRNEAAKASAHYIIGRERGTLYQLAPVESVAWHAGRNWGRWNPNAWSVGYELESPPDDNAPDFTDWQYEALSRLLTWRRTASGQALFFPDSDPATYRPEEYWRRFFSDEPGWVIGHSAVNPGKPDPGPNFDWPRLLERNKFTEARLKK
jgi:N-acetyl-anhydromuramyl-L-alanine amidase AmpD